MADKKLTIGINPGHTVSGTTGSGAIGFLNESNETRAVGYALMEKLRKAGHKVIDCTDNYSPTVSDNLKRICDMANAQPLDVFISIHFNSGGGKGCEAYTYGGKNTAYSNEMLSALTSLGFINRGVKDGSNLYVVRNTTAPACLLEVCFVDSAEDSDLYMKTGADKVAEVLCDAICGNNIIDNNDKGEITMNQYEELKQITDSIMSEIAIINTKINKIENPMIYNYIDDNMPMWARDTVKKLVDKGVLKGDDNGLNLTEEMMRLLVICDRAGAFDK